MDFLLLFWISVCKDEILKTPEQQILNVQNTCGSEEALMLSCSSEFVFVFAKPLNSARVRLLFPLREKVKLFQTCDLCW